MIDLEHILHAGYEGGVGLGRDDPLLLQMRLERVFLSVRPIVLSDARSTIFNCTTCSSSSCKVHRARPLGGCEQASAISRASAAPSKILATDGVARGLRLSTESSPSSTSCLPFRTIVSRRSRSSGSSLTT